MKAPGALMIGLATFFGLVAGDYVINSGIGERTRTVESVFEEKGQKLAIVRESPEIGRDCYYVQSLDTTKFIERGSVIMGKNISGYKVFNYSGKSDSGETIDVRLRGFSVKNQRLENR
jgi:hypothetical protein